MLLGNRVTLRALHRDDLPLVWAFNNDLAVELAGGGDPPMPQRFEQVVADYDRAAAVGGRDNGMFAIEADGRYIGSCGLFGADSTAQTVELGIGIGDKAYWGKGYGREAIQLLLDYAFRYRNYRRVWLRVNASNERGLRAYRACGFIEEGRQRDHVYSDGRYVDLVLMGILRTEWESVRTGDLRPTQRLENDKRGTIEQAAISIRTSGAGRGERRPSFSIWRAAPKRSGSMCSRCPITSAIRCGRCGRAWLPPLLSRPLSGSVRS